MTLYIILFIIINTEDFFRVIWVLVRWSRGFSCCCVGSPWWWWSRQRVSIYIAENAFKFNQNRTWVLWKIKDFFQRDKFWRQLRTFKLCALSNHPYFYADCNINQLLSKKWKVSKTFRRVATWEDCRENCNNFEACEQFNFKVCTEQLWEIHLNC